MSEQQQEQLDTSMLEIGLDNNNKQLDTDHQQAGRQKGRPAGAPNKLKDPASMMQAHQMALLKFFDEALDFSREQLERLRAKAAGIDNIKTQLEVSKTSVEIVEKTSKAVGNVISHLKEQPKDLNEDGERKEFDLGAFINSLK